MVFSCGVLGLRGARVTREERETEREEGEHGVMDGMLSHTPLLVRLQYELRKTVVCSFIPVPITSEVVEDVDPSLEHIVSGRQQSAVRSSSSASSGTASSGAALGDPMHVADSVDDYVTHLAVLGRLDGSGGIIAAVSGRACVKLYDANTFQLTGMLTVRP